MALRRAIECHAQPVHQVDDPRGPVGHLLDRRLMLQEVAAVHRVVQMQPFRVAQLTRLVVARIDPALGTHAVRSLDRGQTHEIHVDAQLGQFHGRGKARQAATNNHHPLF